MPYLNDLNNKICLITGGGQGLGEQICRVLAEAKAEVLVADLNEENAQRVAQEITTKGGKATGVYLNVADQASVESFFQKIKKLDILINNAGTDVTKAVNELSIEEWDKVLDVNLKGPFLMSKQALSLMKEQGSGQIVNICSTAAKRTWTEASAYHASKWGLLGFSHALHTEARKENIKVSAVIVGGMKTPFILDRFPEAEPNLQDPKNVAETVLFILTRPDETVIPEMMVLPLKETSWP